MSIYRDFTIRRKLQIGLGLLIFLLGCLAIYLLISISNYERFVSEIQEATEYNITVQEIQVDNLAKVDLLKRYLIDRNPLFLEQIEVRQERIRANLEEIRVLGGNPIILNNLADITELFRQRSALINTIIDNFSNPEAVEDDFFVLLAQIDNLSNSLAYDLDRINEVAFVDRIQQIELLDTNFYLNRVTSLGLLFIVTLFLVVVSYILINSISNPLRRMIIASEEIAKGNFEYELDISSNDEIGTLARSFESMRLRLNDLYSSMEQKVKARTKKLNEAVRELNGTKESLISTLQMVEEKQKNIEKQKTRFEAILYNLGEGLVFMDKDTKIVFGNKAVTDLLGYSSGDYVGKKWYKLVEPRHENGKIIPYEELSLNRLIDIEIGAMADVTLSDDHYYKKKDGTLLPVSVIASKVVHEGEVIGLILVFKDVTKEKEVDKAKTEFVSLASHQLRTPLTSISWNTEMLLNGEVGDVEDDQKEYLEEIYYGSKRMINLVNSLLNTSRIDLGNFVVEPEEVDVVNFTKEIVEELDQNFEERKIKLKTVYDKVGKMPLDKKLYHIMVENLLTNAIKYTEVEGSVTLELEKSRDGLLIKVSDTGYGIPEDQKTKIFSKLFRADNVKAKDTDGTGLGLYLVKSVVDYIGGKIWFDSIENEGTTFYILLPKDGMKPKQGEKTITRNKN